MVPPLCGEQVKLLGERQLLIAGIFRLLFTHRMDQLAAAQHHAGAVGGLKAEHRTYAAFDEAVILLDTIVEVATLPNPNRLELTSESVLQPVRRVTGQDRSMIGLNCSR